MSDEPLDLHIFDLMGRLREAGFIHRVDSIRDEVVMVEIVTARRIWEIEFHEDGTIEYGRRARAKDRGGPIG